MKIISVIFLLFLFYIQIYGLETDEIYVVYERCDPYDVEKLAALHYVPYPVYNEDIGCEIPWQDYVKECTNETLVLCRTNTVGGECSCSSYNPKYPDWSCVVENNNMYSYCTHEIKELDDGECHAKFYREDDPDDPKCEKVDHEKVFKIGELAMLADTMSTLHIYPNEYMFMSYADVTRAYYYNYIFDYPDQDECIETKTETAFNYMRIKCRHENVIQTYKYQIEHFYRNMIDLEDTYFYVAKTKESCIDGIIEFMCTKNKITGKYLSVIKFYENEDCSGEIEHIQMSEESLNCNNYCTYCSDSIPIIPGGVMTLVYVNEDQCDDLNKASILVHKRVDACNDKIHSRISYIDTDYINKTHYSYTIFETISQCSDISGYGQFYSCLHVNVPWKENIDVYLKPMYLIDDIPSLLNETNCDGTKCVLSGEFVLPPIHVNVPLESSNSTMIINLNGTIENMTMIYVDRDGEVNVEDDVIVINIETSEDYENLIEKIESEGSYQLTLIDGKYNGKIKDHEIRLASSVNDCKKLSSKLIEDKEKLLIGFSLDSSGCGSKWWIPLLIVEGVVFVALVVFIILVFTVKPIRSFFLPYNRN